MALEANMWNDKNTYDVLIVGGGPASLTAAIYVKRANLKVGYIEKNVPGGKIVVTPLIENFPSFEKIDGPDLALKMFEHANNIGVEYIYGNVTNIHYNDKSNRHIVSTEDGLMRMCKVVIIATGAEEKTLNVPGESQYIKKGISFCAICDGSLAKNKNVFVVGGGNSGATGVLYLANISTHVTLIHRSESFKAEQVLLDQIKKLKNVTILLNTTIEKINGNGSNISSLEILNSKENKKETVPCDFLFEYVGSLPATKFLDLNVYKNEDGYLIVNEDYETNVPGVYACGDCIKKKFRQVTTALGDATNASLNAIRYIKEKF